MPFSQRPWGHESSVVFPEFSHGRLEETSQIARTHDKKESVAAVPMYILVTFVKVHVVSIDL